MPVTVLINSGEGGSTGEQQGVETPTTEKAQPGRTKTSSFTKSAINTALIQGARQLGSQGINVYTSISGDTATGRQLDSALSVGSDILMIAKGGMVGVAAVLGKHAMTAINSTIEVRKANIETEKANVLLGEISMKGSRY